MVSFAAPALFFILKVRDARFKPDTKEWEDSEGQRIPRFVERFRVLFEDFRGGNLSKISPEIASTEKWADAAVAASTPLKRSLSRRRSSHSIYLVRTASIRTVQASVVWYLRLRQGCGGYYQIVNILRQIAVALLLAGAITVDPVQQMAAVVGLYAFQICWLCFLFPFVRAAPQIIETLSVSCEGGSFACGLALPLGGDPDTVAWTMLGLMGLR